MKKLLALAACMMLLSTLTVNGTLAFSIEGIVASLTQFFGSEPENESDELKAATLIQVRSGSGMRAASEDEMLLPANYARDFHWNATQEATINGHTCKLWPESGVQNAVDKFISVRNDSTGKAIYFRTDISVNKAAYALLKINLNQSDVFKWTDWTEDGDYMTIAAVYTEALQPGGISPPMMLQIAMRNDVTNAQLAALGAEKLEIIRTNTLAIAADTPVTGDETITADQAVKLLMGQNPN